VLDDGWFGKRANDTSSLGDWVADLAKFPHGIKGLAEEVNAAGCKFGIWFEPEMVSDDSVSTLFDCDLWRRVRCLFIRCVLKPVVRFSVLKRIVLINLRCLTLFLQHRTCTLRTLTGTCTYRAGPGRSVATRWCWISPGRRCGTTCTRLSAASSAGELREMVAITGRMISGTAEIIISQ
jgi:hypothetical protein